jgi:serine/threonine protein kinase
MVDDSVRSPSWARHVDDPDAWAVEHQWLLDAIFALFDRDGDWPQIETLQRVLATSDPARAIAVEQLAIDIPSELGSRNGNQFTLTVRALSHCPSASGLLSVFVAAVREAAAVYRASDEEHRAMLSGFHVKDRLELDDAAYLRLSMLLFRELWFFGSGGGNHDEDWHFEIRVQILLAEHVTDVAEYLDVVAAYRFGPPAVEISGAAGDVDTQARVLRLQREWELGEQIGAGGFGSVWVAHAGNEEAVAKLIPKAPGADRELLFVGLGDARNVVPIIDHGEFEGNWVLIMPRAEKSLRDHIETASSFDGDAVRCILADIASTLVDLDGRVVHRDIKPENVLLLDGRWCLADFGISRYAEATTAADTHKFAMSPAYAAPERWRSQRATAKTDVYAVGIIGYEMLAGARPFVGPSAEDFREQHLHAKPKALEAAEPALEALIEACLIKAPEARPSPASLLVRIEKPKAAGSPGLARLQEASRSQISREAEGARLASEKGTEEQRRADLYEAARDSLRGIADGVVDAIESASEMSIARQLPDGAQSLKLGPAELRILASRLCSAVPTGTGRRIPFDVVASSALGIHIPQDRYGYEGRSHSLWFCDAQRLGEYAWFETAFTIMALAAKETNRAPFDLAADAPEAREAVGPGVGLYQVAWPFTRIDSETLDEFISRWAGWLADGSQGLLHRPTTLPEQSADGSWRRG